MCSRLSTRTKLLPMPWYFRNVVSERADTGRIHFAEFAACDMDRGVNACPLNELLRPMRPGPETNAQSLEDDPNLITGGKALEITNSAKPVIPAFKCCVGLVEGRANVSAQASCCNCDSLLCC